MMRRAAAELRTRALPGTTAAGCAARRSAADRPGLDAGGPAVGHPGSAGEHEAVVAAAAADARGPGAAEGTNLGLVHAALRRIPGGAPFAIVRAGRWGSASSPNRSLAFVWQAGQSWTQFVLAPRVQVAPGDAVWLLVRGADPAAAGIRHPLHAWRFGPDWLVEVRR